MSYKYALLDPRPTEEADAANDAVFAAAGGEVHGVEVTQAKLAKRCSSNLDPQHTGGDPTTAAITAALTCDIPRKGATLVTVRSDLDSIGAFTVITMRANGNPISREARRIIDAIAAADTFTAGPWPGQRPLPTVDNPWPEGPATVSGTKELAAFAAMAEDRTVPLDTRVQSVMNWFKNGYGAEDPVYRDRVEKERLDMVSALSDGRITTEVVDAGRIAVVTSTYRAGLDIGYYHAPVVVALNPVMPGPNGPFKKYTVCAWCKEHADIRAVISQLSEIEAGWAGSPTIGGSPQGRSSSLSLGEVVSVVTEHLL